VFTFYSRPIVNALQLIDISKHFVRTTQYNAICYYKHDVYAIVYIRKQSDVSV